MVEDGPLEKRVPSQRKRPLCKRFQFFGGDLFAGERQAEPVGKKEVLNKKKQRKYIGIVMLLCHF